MFDLIISSLWTKSRHITGQGMKKPPWNASVSTGKVKCQSRRRGIRESVDNTAGVGRVEKEEREEYQTDTLIDGDVPCLPIIKEFLHDNIISNEEEELNNTNSEKEEEEEGENDEKNRNNNKELEIEIKGINWKKLRMIQRRKYDNAERDNQNEKELRIELQKLDIEKNQRLVYVHEFQRQITNTIAYLESIREGIDAGEDYLNQLYEKKKSALIKLRQNQKKMES